MTRLTLNNLTKSQAFIETLFIYDVVGLSRRFWNCSQTFHGLWLEKKVLKVGSLCLVWSAATIFGIQKNTELTSSA